MTSILPSDVKKGDGSRVAKCLNEICFATHKKTQFLLLYEMEYMSYSRQNILIFLAHLSQRLTGELIVYQ